RPPRCGRADPAATDPAVRQGGFCLDAHRGASRFGPRPPPRPPPDSPTPDAGRITRPPPRRWAARGPAGLGSRGSTWSTRAGGMLTLVFLLAPLPHAPRRERPALTRGGGVSAG